MRIVHASFHRDPAGRPAQELLQAWPTLVAVARAAQDQNHQVIVVQAHHLDERVNVQDIEVIFTRDVATEVRRSAADVVHVHGLGFPVDTRALCSKLNGTPVLVQDHGGGAPGHLRRPLLRWGLNRVRGAAFTATEQAARYATMLPRNVRVFEVLESSSHFTPGPMAEAREATGLHGNPCLLWVGRLNHNKDPLTTLRAMRRAAEALPELQLFCCFGESDLLPRVCTVVDTDPVLRSRVHLLGRVTHERVQQLCRAADFFVASSRSEGSGYALLEAVSCGLTPIVTDIPSFRAMTRGGALGALFPAGDADAMAAQIVRLAAQPRDDLRARALAHFQEHLSFDVVGRQLRSAYQALLA